MSMHTNPFTGEILENHAGGHGKKSGGGSAGKARIKAAGFNTMFSDDEFGKFHPEAQDVIASRFEKLAKDYPGIGRTANVELAEGGDGSNAATMIDRGIEGKTIELSKDMFSEKGFAKTQKQVAKSQKSGFLAGDGGVAHLIDHELAHVIDKAPFGLQQQWPNVGKAKKYIRENPPKAKDLSRYGVTDKFEVFAEAMAASRTAAKPTAWQAGLNKAMKE